MKTVTFVLFALISVLTGCASTDTYTRTTRDADGRETSVHEKKEHTGWPTMSTVVVAPAYAPSAVCWNQMYNMMVPCGGMPIGTNLNIGIGVMYHRR